MRTTTAGSILVGDLNIAPLEHDVWSHKQLLKVVSHTPVETESFEAMRKAGDWVDLMRHDRAGRAEALHLVELSRAATGRCPTAAAGSTISGRRPTCRRALTGIEILREARGWDRPSDHVPVIARFDLD